MVLTFLLLSTLAFAQDAESSPTPPTEQGAEAKTEASEVAPEATPQTPPQAPPDAALRADFEEWEDTSDEDVEQWEDTPAEVRSDPGLDELEFELGGGSNDDRMNTTLSPLMVGVAAGCSSALCLGLGIGACVGTTIYYSVKDPRISSESGTTRDQFGEEARKQRARQAFIGGAFGIVTGLGVRFVVISAT